MLTATCGTCKGKHNTIEEYRNCQGAPQTEAEVMDRLSGTTTTIARPSDKQVRYALDLLATRVWPDTFTEEDLKGMERRQVSELIDGLFKAKKISKGQIGAKSPKPQEYKDIPDGRYALKDKDGVWKFFQVNHGHTRIFVDMLIGAPGAYRKQKMYGGVADQILRGIRDVTPRQASIDFGLQSGTCGVCSSPLTNEDSLKYGIGPICRGKMGW
jgi:uncharacterized CHY-type Zn-finger protein